MVNVYSIKFYDEVTKKYYTTKDEFDHSMICDLVDLEDLEEIPDIKDESYYEHMNHQKLNEDD